MKFSSAVILSFVALAYASPVKDIERSKEAERNAPSPDVGLTFGSTDAEGVQAVKWKRSEEVERDAPTPDAVFRPPKGDPTSELVYIPPDWSA